MTGFLRQVFQLYEHEEGVAIQLIGAKLFDESDSDWACDEAFSSREGLFELPLNGDWRDCLRVAKSLVEEYLETGKQASHLKASRAVNIGFADGDLELVYLHEING